MLVIFDCDGVLVDSERLGAQVFSALLAGEGISMTVDACFNVFRGMTLSACFEWIEQRWSCTLSDDFLTNLNTATQLLFRQELKPIKGVESVLKHLRQRTIPVCVASNGGREKIANSLASTGLNRYFSSESCFSAQQVNHGKPDPALFLYAAETLGVAPRFCTVIEDSLAGCEAAKAAGMKLIFFCEHLAIPDGVKRLNPDLTVESMSSLLQYFQAQRH